MNEVLALLGRLVRVLIPTPLQALGSVLLAILIMLVAQGSMIFARFGIPEETFLAARDNLVSRMQGLLSLPILSDAAVITFWAAIGLGAYLLVWAIYRVVVEARYDVTIETQYTGRGEWQGMMEALGFKLLAGVGIIQYLISFSGLLSFWLSLSGSFFSEMSPSGILSLVAAVLGLSLQLYAFVILIQLIFTPWYRPETFTELSE